jgi:hypothetical protein
MKNQEAILSRSSREFTTSSRRSLFNSLEESNYSKLKKGTCGPLF